MGKGKKPEEPRVHGVGFAVKNSLLSTAESPSSGTARILSLRPSTFSGPVNILSVHAPTLCSSAEIKDQFYEELDATIRDIPATDQLYLLGDFNARVGSDRDSWPSCIGHFGIGKMNENGQRLLELCSYHDLCITSTFFAIKPHRRVSWRHPRSRHWHQLDLVIIRRPSLNCVLTTRSYHSADYDTDHSMVGSKVRLQPKRIHRSKQKGRPRINTSKTAIPDLCERFANSIEDALKNCPNGNAEERWSSIRDVIYNSAMDTFGKRERQNPDWFEAGIAELEPAIEAKRAALINHKREPSVKSLAALRKARNDAQRIARRCANDYWLNLCESIQLSADCSNTRSMCEGMKKAFGPSINKIVPLKSATELSKAIDSLACGKAPGIPPEVIKVGKKTALLHHLHQLLPQEMRDANIITLYKNKGDRSDCNNYRGISLSIVGKAFTHVVLNRLQLLAERVYPERQLLYIAFIDLGKAFDLVSRNGLFTLLQKIGYPPKLLRMITYFHKDMQGTVQCDGSSSDPLPIKIGVKQLCILAPTLFGIFFSLLLSYAFNQSEDGVKGPSHQKRRQSLQTCPPLS
ncbi:uncharacterized protein LOC119589633 [Penaeus monodon]|uniref:uncharacterized protein LOC119589633 n=1 Tax=Penaeus monodon TaxID=6687 RepID=UPI0018A6DC7A|nr:uncharacterized protein LOC119589633 [Penaeus monodon]